MHILILPSWYPNNRNDISGCFFREQAIAISDNNCKVGVISIEINSVKNIFKKKNIVDYENDENVITYRKRIINLLPRMDLFAELTIVNLGLKMYKEYVDQHGTPDLIHVHSLLYSGLLAKKIYELYNVPYVVTEHSSQYFIKNISNKRINSLISILKDAKARYAVSSEFAKKLEGTTALKWKVKHNIVNQDFLDYPLDQVNQQEEFSFITICYLNNNKNISLLIEAFYQSFKSAKNIKLKIGGDGEERKKLEDKVKKLGMTDQVEFLGMLKREEVIKKISCSSVYVLSSKFETFGVALIEALALGKPVIATKCGGPEDIVNEINGFLVKNNDVKDLSKRLKYIYNNISSYNSTLIRADCEKRFSIKNITTSTIRDYKILLER